MHLTVGSFIQVLKRAFHVRYQAWLLPLDQNLKDLCYGAFPALLGDIRDTLSPWKHEMHFEIFYNNAVWRPQMNSQSVV